MFPASIFLTLALALASGTQATNGPTVISPATDPDSSSNSTFPPLTSGSTSNSSSPSAKNSSSSATAAAVASTPAPANQILPCARGQGDENGCGYCSNTTGIPINDWHDAKFTDNFTLPGAEAKSGPGWDVYWNVQSVNKGCYAVLIVPPTQRDGSSISGVIGNAVLSAGQPGCYYANVKDKVAAAFCCGSGDCAKIGALPPPPPPPSKREISEQRETPTKREMTTVVRRNDGSFGNPPTVAPAAPSEPPKPNIFCTPAKAVGDYLYKSGQQQVDGNVLNCGGGEFCGINPSIATTAGSTYTNEHSTTLTQTNGIQVSVAAQVAPFGVGTTITGGYNHDWSNALADSLSTAHDNSTTKTQSWSVNVSPGSRYQGWFAPSMVCQPMNTTCNGVDMTIEKCVARVQDGTPQGELGVITVG